MEVFTCLFIVTIMMHVSTLIYFIQSTHQSPSTCFMVIVRRAPFYTFLGTNLKTKNEKIYSHSICQVPMLFGFCFYIVFRKPNFSKCTVIYSALQHPASTIIVELTYFIMKLTYFKVPSHSFEIKPIRTFPYLNSTYTRIYYCLLAAAVVLPRHRR